ncbi:MAG: hypothetical protein GY757_33950 [bacterium]|nr:hypothetical protein [bacterium]
MNYKELSRFYSDLATFLTTGLTIPQGLEVLKNSKKGREMWLMDGIQHDVLKGKELWQSMSRYPKHFDSFQVMMIKGAEKAGQLADVTAKLSQYYENRHREKQKFIAGMIYPLILLHAVVFLPPLKYLIVASLEGSYWARVLPPLVIGYGIIGAGFFIWKNYCRSGNLREQVDRLLLRLPVIGKLARDMSLVRIFWTMGNLVNSGVDAVTAARSAIPTASNTIITQRLQAALYVLESGRSFKDYFSISSVLNVEQMAVVTIGEQAGSMVESLERMVRKMEGDNEMRFAALNKAATFGAYFIAAAIVAMTVIAFYTEYFNILN